MKIVHPVTRTQYEFLSVVDVVSRAAWLEYYPRGGSPEYCLYRAFTALGVPKMISTDNGFGFSPYTRSSPSRPIHYAFSRVRRSRACGKYGSPPRTTNRTG